MKAPSAPRLEPRRAADFAAQLRERARAWIPSWGLADGERDFGAALLEIAARFSSEVAERLDRVPEKMRRGFLDWLAVRGQAARPARLPVVFKLADTARDAVLAAAPVRLQAEAGGATVVFETETDVRLVPGRLEVVVGADAGADAIYLPPPGLSDLEPLEPLPVQWQLKTFAAAGATTLQVDPESGLAPGMVIEAGGRQYRVVQADKEIVTIDPPLAGELDGLTIVRKVAAFAPFDGVTRNRQEHALYLGHNELLDIEAAATIAVAGAQSLRTGVTWQYWGKADPFDQETWQPLTLRKAQLPGAVVLRKPKGAIVPREIDGRKSRWLRAYRKTVSGAEPLALDQLTIAVNPADCSTKDLWTPDASVPSPAAEGMANTTPLVLESPFFPLGRAPRQFDAFYLGSSEAFSKKEADVQLDFTLSEPAFRTLTRAPAGPWGNVLAGVAKDGALHLVQFNPTTRRLEKFRNQEPSQPPSVMLDKEQPWRLPVWVDSSSNDLFIAATAKGEVWIRQEHVNQSDAGTWTRFGVPSPSLPESTPIDGLVYLDGPPKQLAALRGGELSFCEWPNGAWAPVTTSATLQSIVPIVNQPSQVAGIAGLELYTVDTAGNDTLVFSASFDPAVRPAVVLVGTNVHVAAATPNSLVSNKPRTSALNPNDEVLGPIDIFVHNGNLHFLAAVHNDSGDYLASWAPFDPTAPVKAFEIPIPGSLGGIGGAVTALDHDVVIPGAHADVFGTAFDPSRRYGGTADVLPGVVLPSTAPGLTTTDTVARVTASDANARPITSGPYPDTGEVLYEIAAPFSGFTTGGAIVAYRTSQTALSGTLTSSPDELVLVNPAVETEFLLIGGATNQIVSLNAGVATMASPPSTANYYEPLPTGGRAASFMKLDPLGNGNWDPALLDSYKVLFLPTNTYYAAKEFAIIPTPTPPHRLVVCADDSPAPATGKFLIDASATKWERILGDNISFPELSWEYWNGKGWWQLHVTTDKTLNLKTAGKIEFRIPDDIAPSDWAGKTNYWIRARLVGGDFGAETITTTSVSSGNTVQQTIHRSTDGIRAPVVVRLSIAYRLCQGVLPLFVLAEDSRSTRDQSDANRTGGAIVEAFVPLSYMLGRLSGTEPQSGRALFIGLNATPSGVPVNVLLLVDQEAPHDSFAPMKIETLIADRFVPVVANDTTRALGESGLLSIDFAVPPTPRELFGYENLTWLRLAPAAAGSTADWKPSLRGAYLNAVWTSAAETLTRELLGSSEGAPNLTVHLARPPVLRDTLELRVREPLGDEERQTLRIGDETRVLSAVEGLPGDWVRWTAVADPGDTLSSERVYTLDESDGEIRFGDGQHGMIPPIGRDSIVAFRYRRTEIGGSTANDVPANAVAARTALNLVSPVESVEAVFAAGQAAGGAPPESDERVVRFGGARLRHRSRAVTARDFEDLALESSPAIVQARCFVRAGRARLVVVMRGDDPLPNAAQVRELGRLLLDAAPPSLTPDRLRITGPRVRRARVVVKPRVASLDDAGAVSAAVQQRVRDLFDTAAGGADKDGWPLGATPSEDDVALALLGTPRLISVGGVELHEVNADGRESPWTEDARPDQLVMLDKDGVRLEFRTVEVIA